MRKRSGEVGEVMKSEEWALEKVRRTRSRSSAVEEVGEGSFLEEERELRSHLMRTKAVSRYPVHSRLDFWQRKQVGLRSSH